MKPHTWFFVAEFMQDLEASVDAMGTGPRVQSPLSAEDVETLRLGTIIVDNERVLVVNHGGWLYVVIWQ